ncbi:hypothetical protein TNIN_187041 [Trichonephila inaurata madagascariensis]|uniref:Uncharacterized protein n=1 Tax=Trichonephila inaurata madagascariensis TaxID=2747483 RepID=A0A8X6MCW8_9ARAC|nr:hypothetical protein TNIN_187041 [Trichonephila inaurata madagascariensis]
MVGIVAGGGRIDKPILKAGEPITSISLVNIPTIEVVTINILVKLQLCVERSSAGGKVGLIAARRTGPLSLVPS